MRPRDQGEAALPAGGGSGSGRREWPLDRGQRLGRPPDRVLRRPAPRPGLAHRARLALLAVVVLRLFLVRLLRFVCLGFLVIHLQLVVLHVIVGVVVTRVPPTPPPLPAGGSRQPR